MVLKIKPRHKNTREGPILVLLLILISTVFFLDTSSVGKGIEDIVYAEHCGDIFYEIEPTGEKRVWGNVGIHDVRILGSPFMTDTLRCQPFSRDVFPSDPIYYPSGLITFGPDNDNDGVKSTVVVHYDMMVIEDPTLYIDPLNPTVPSVDLNNPTPWIKITMDVQPPSPLQSVFPLDSPPLGNDNNPCDPNPQITTDIRQPARRSDGGFDVYSSITICSTTNTTNQVNRTTPATYPQNISNVPTGNWRNTKDSDLDGITQIEVEFGDLVITGDPNILGNWKHFENTNYQAQNAPDPDDNDNSNPKPIPTLPTITPYLQCNGIDSARLVLTSGQVKYKGQNYPESQITHDTTCLTSGQLPTAKYTIYNGAYTFGPDADVDGVPSTISLQRTNYWIDANGQPQSEPATSDTPQIDTNDNDNSNPKGYFDPYPILVITPNCNGLDTIRITFNSGRYKQNGQYYPAAPITQDTGCANAGILPYTTPAYPDPTNPIPTAVDADNDGIAGQYRIAQRTTTIPKTNPTNVQHAPANPLIAQGPDLYDTDQTYPKPKIEGPYYDIRIPGNVPTCSGIDTVYIAKAGAKVTFKGIEVNGIVENKCVESGQGFPIPILGYDSGCTFIDHNNPTYLQPGPDNDLDGYPQYYNYLCYGDMALEKNGSISYYYQHELVWFPMDIFDSDPQYPGNAPYYLANYANLAFYDGFEDGTLAPFTTSSSYFWTVENESSSNSAYTGTKYASASQDGSANRVSTLSLALSVPHDTTISFAYTKVGPSALEFSINGCAYGEGNGLYVLGQYPTTTIGLWSYFTAPVKAGNCVFTWKQTGSGTPAKIDDVAIGFDPQHFERRLAKLNPGIPNVSVPQTPDVNYSTSDWPFRRKITINNPGSALTDYQIPLSIDTATLILQGKLLTDCTNLDVLDSDGSTRLPYWIESGCDTFATKIWVKVPNIPQESKTIYMAYGASASITNNDPNNIFDLYDDFEIGYNNSKWNTYGLIREMRQANGVMRIESASSIDYPPFLTSKKSFASGVLEYKANASYDPQYTICYVGMACMYSTPHILGAVKFHSDSGYPGIQTVFQGTGTQPVQSNNLIYFTDGQSKFGWVSYERITQGIFYLFKVSFSGSNLAFEVTNTDTGSTQSTSYLWGGSLPANPVGIGAWNAGVKVDFDWVRVRKYANPEPTATVGPEEGI